jgi:hypothetical protein
MLPPWTWLVASDSRKTGKGDESRHERTTSDCIWIAQILLTGIFLIPGGSKLLAYERVMGVVEARSKGIPAGVSCGLAAFIGVAEIAGALGAIRVGKAREVGKLSNCLENSTKRLYNSGRGAKSSA